MAAILPIQRNLTTDVAVNRRKLGKLADEIIILRMELENIEQFGDRSTHEDLMMDVSWVKAHLERLSKLVTKLKEQSRPVVRRNSV
jgi:hypothetical protein